MDCSPSGSSVHGSLQARIQEWVAMPSLRLTLLLLLSRFSCVRLCATPWTAAYQAPPTMGFSRREYWSGLPFPSPGDLFSPGFKRGSPALQADSLPSEPPGKSLRKLCFCLMLLHCFGQKVHLDFSVPPYRKILNDCFDRHDSSLY